MKKFVALLLAVLMVASLCACGQKDTGSDLQTVTKGKLIMSTNAEFAPYEYVADDGKGFQGTGYEGIDIEIAYALAQKLGLELVVDNMDFDAALSAVQTGKSDMVAAGVTVTPDEVLPPVPVTLGVRGTVQPVLTSENTLLVEKALANGLTKEVALAESVAAPVYAGDTLGQLTVRDAAGNTVAELPILAGEDVGHVTFVQMLGRCLARGFCMGAQS